MVCFQLWEYNIVKPSDSTEKEHWKFQVTLAMTDVIW